MKKSPRHQRALQECAAEPIHLVGAIQPPGVLLVYQRDTRRVVAASANATELFEAENIGQVLCMPVESVLEGLVLQLVSDVVSRGEPGPSRLAGVANVGPLGALHNVSAHACGSLVHVELEPAGIEAGPDEGLAALALDSSPRESLLQSLAGQVQRLSGYSRVMVYRFLHDATGEVVAESLDGKLPSYMGLRYPASDIPPQARAL